MSKLLFTPTTQEPMANAFLPSISLLTALLGTRTREEGTECCSQCSVGRERARDVKWNLSAGDERRAAWLAAEREAMSSVARKGWSSRFVT